jgi:hypothetical protein
MLLVLRLASRGRPRYFPAEVLAKMLTGATTKVVVTRQDLGFTVELKHW